MRNYRARAPRRRKGREPGENGASSAVARTRANVYLNDRPPEGGKARLEVRFPPFVASFNTWNEPRAFEPGRGARQASDSSSSSHVACQRPDLEESTS